MLFQSSVCTAQHSPNQAPTSMYRADAYFMALGIIGTSVFASSGDKGAHAGCEFAILNGDGGCGEWITS
jgi:subtilase family serine protease